MANELTDTDKLDIINQHIRSLEYNQYNLTLSKLEENASSRPDADILASIDGQLADNTAKLSALNSEKAKLSAQSLTNSTAMSYSYSDSDSDEYRAHGDPIIAELLREKKEKDRELALKASKIELLSSLIQKDKNVLYLWEVERLLADVPTSGLSEREILEIDRCIQEVKDRIDKDALELDRLQNDNE